MMRHGSLAAGMLVAALYPDDKEIYRARVLDVAAAVRLCPDLLGDEQIAGLGRLVGFVGGFYAANTYPSKADRRWLWPGHLRHGLQLQLAD